MIGGQAVLRKYGKAHFKALRKLWGEKYTWKPVSTSGYALVVRETGVIVATVGSIPSAR